MIFTQQPFLNESSIKYVAIWSATSVINAINYHSYLSFKHKLFSCKQKKTSMILVKIINNIFIGLFLLLMIGFWIAIAYNLDVHYTCLLTPITNYLSKAIISSFRLQPFGKKNQKRQIKLLKS